MRTKTINTISKEDHLLNIIKNTGSFRSLMENLPDNELGYIDVSFRYTPKKKHIFSEDTDLVAKDGRFVHSKTREFESGFKDVEVAKKVSKNLEKKDIIKETDAKGDTIIYAEDWRRRINQRG